MGEGGGKRNSVWVAKVEVLVRTGKFGGVNRDPVRKSSLYFG